MRILRYLWGLYLPKSVITINSDMYKWGDVLTSKTVTAYVLKKIGSTPYGTTYKVGIHFHPSKPCS